jgi:hypothetical protein
METVLRSATKELRIGPEQPFCIIGERINPTGRKIFQDQLRQGDLSRVEIDVAQQVAGGAMVLDINMGAPLADEAELMDRAVKLVQGLCDLPLCIDSSVIEALEAGLSAYQGKALVNSVTAEDDRMAEILPLVARHGAAVIALPNDEEEIPAEPERRVALARKIIETATGVYLAGRRHPGDDPAADRRVRGEHDARRVERVVRHAGPGRDRQRVPAHGHQGRPDQRDHGRPVAAAGPLGQGRGPAAEPGRVGRGVDRGAPGPAGG